MLGSKVKGFFHGWHPDIDGIFDPLAHAVMDDENFIAEQSRDLDPGPEWQDVRGGDAIPRMGAISRNKRGAVGFVGHACIGRDALV